MFLFQQSQNKDSGAVHVKLNELRASNNLPSNRMIGIDHMDGQGLHDMGPVSLQTVCTTWARLLHRLAAASC